METDKKPDPSAAGTATHLFLQFCDFNRLLADGAATEAKRLADNSFITGDDGELIRLDEIDLFTKSSLFKRMLGAKKIYRELRFNSLVPASQFTEQAELARELEADGTKICVQGVVDCLFTDKNGKTVLVDYKTDRLTEAELADVSLAADKLTKRHRDQLLMYRRICSEMTGSDIDEVLIYSLPLGDAIELTGE